MNASPSRPRPRRSDPTLFELLMLPVLMGGLSLTMWFSLPTFGEALAARRSELDARHAAIGEMVRSLARTQMPVTPTCAHVLPRPAFVDNDPKASNTLILSGRETTALAISDPLPFDLDLTLTGALYYLIESRTYVTGGGRPMTRNRIADEIDGPLSARYVLLYGTTMQQPVAQAADGSVQGRVAVEAFLFDFASNVRVCTLAFTVAMDPAFRTDSDFAQWAHSELWMLTRNELVTRLTGSEHVP